MSVFAGARGGVHVHVALRICSLHPHCALGGAWREGQHQLHQDGLLSHHHLPDQTFLRWQTAQVCPLCVYLGLTQSFLSNPPSVIVPG